jgi:hypothetical protein
MNLNGAIHEFAERKEQISTAAILAYGRQRAHDAAAQLTRRGHAAASAELANEAVTKLIAILYQPDTDGLPCNFDLATGRLLVPAPWGSVGRPLYGLRRTEGDTLRRYMQFLEDQARPPRLFFFEVGSWHVNVWDWPTATDALHYWRLVQLTVDTWKRFLPSTGRT